MTTIDNSFFLLLLYRKLKQITSSMEILTYQRFRELVSHLGITVFSITFRLNGFRMAFGVDTDYPVFFRSFSLPTDVLDEAHAWSYAFRIALSELLIISK